uniref:Secreted protein n=1 Tax=Anser brachyrhynchus TaxID=132585 RepID=A0A8B9CIU5_9AVES
FFCLFVSHCLVWLFCSAKFSERDCKRSLLFVLSLKPSPLLQYASLHTIVCWLVRRPLPSFSGVELSHSLLIFKVPWLISNETSCQILTGSCWFAQLFLHCASIDLGFI